MCLGLGCPFCKGAHGDVLLGFGGCQAMMCQGSTCCWVIGVPSQPYWLWGEARAPRSPTCLPPPLCFQLTLSPDLQWP